MSQLRKQLGEVQDDQKSKSLDAREALIAKKEAILNEDERIARIEVLDKQIAVKEGIKKDIEHKVNDLQHDFTAKSDILKNSIDDLKRERATLQRSNKYALDNIDSLKRSNEDLKSQIHILEVQLKERKKYLQDQEKIVDDTIADWNMRLNELQLEANTIIQSKESAAGDILRLIREKEQLEVDIEALEQKAMDLDGAYKVKVSDYKDKLRVAKCAVNDALAEADRIKLKNAATLQGIETREQALQVQAQSQAKREAEIVDREKRINMRFNMLGLNQS